MSLLMDLFNTLDKPSLGRIASALGESDQSVSRGMQSAIATVLGGMACKSDNSTLLRRSLDLAPSSPEGVTWSSLASDIADAHSPGMIAGNNILSTLFGGSEGSITQALGTGISLRPSSTSSLLAMAAPMVMSFLGKRVHDQGMSMGGLGNLLQRETPAIREALPSGVTDLLWPRIHERVAAPSVVAQTITRESSSPARWLIPLVLLALIPGLIWLLSRGHRPVVQTPSEVSGTANRVLPGTQINAAGATFPMPIYQKWFQSYHTEHPSVQINYGVAAPEPE